MMLVVAFVVAAVAAAVRAQVEVHECHDKISFGEPNMLPVLDVDAEPTARKLQARVRNGKWYTVSVADATRNQTTQFQLVHLWGTPYEAGYAYGKLMGSRLTHFLDTTWAYLVSMVEHAEEGYLPPFLHELVADVGLDVALDLTEYVTKPFTAAHFYDELRGMADASGCDFQLAVRVHMLAGLTQGHCSSFGAWGSATADGRTVSMRALDWDMKGPFRDHAQVTVYHRTVSDDAGGGDGGGGRDRSNVTTAAFANVGFTGFVAGLTGINEHGVAITEIGVSYPDATWGVESRIGVPFVFLLRDVLQFDAERGAALSRMRRALRTCDLILGVADRAAYNAVQYSFSNFYVMSDTNLRPVNATWHAPIADAVYHGMDWMCPAYGYVLGTQLRKHHGAITPALAVQQVAGVLKSGDVHIAVYDNERADMYVSFAAPQALAGDGDRAYERRFTKLTGKSLFAETQQ